MKNKKGLAPILIIIGMIILVYFGLYLTGSLDNTYTDYTEKTISYSGQINSFGTENPNGYLVDNSYNCGNRANIYGTVYSWCQVDKNQLNFIPYQICIDDKIDKIGVLNLEISGTANCLKWPSDTSTTCGGTIDFYNDEKNLINQFLIVQTRRTDNQKLLNGPDFSGDVTLDLSNGYKNINGNNCFTIYISNPSKSGRHGDIQINYNINKAKLNYDKLNQTPTINNPANAPVLNSTITGAPIVDNTINNIKQNTANVTSWISNFIHKILGWFGR